MRYRLMNPQNYSESVQSFLKTQREIVGIIQNIRAGLKGKSTTVKMVDLKKAAIFWVNLSKTSQHYMKVLFIYSCPAALAYYLYSSSKKADSDSTLSALKHTLFYLAVTLKLLVILSATLMFGAGYLANKKILEHDQLTDVLPNNITDDELLHACKKILPQNQYREETAVNDIFQKTKEYLIFESCRTALPKDKWEEWRNRLSADDMLRKTYEYVHSQKHEL